MCSAVAASNVLDGVGCTAVAVAVLVGLAAADVGAGGAGGGENDGTCNKTGVCWRSVPMPVSVGLSMFMLKSSSL